MALLPSVGGKNHAPTALQSLIEPGSPIADVYEVCTQCQVLLADEKQAHEQLAKVSIKLTLCSGIDCNPYQTC